MLDQKGNWNKGVENIVPDLKSLLPRGDKICSLTLKKSKVDSPPSKPLRKWALCQVEQCLKNLHS